MRRRKIKASDGTVSYGRWRSTFDLTDENAERLKQIMANTLLTETQVMNKLIEKSPIPSSYPLAPTHKELQSFRLEISKIGSNINQIAKRLNSENRIEDKLIRYYLNKITEGMLQLETISSEVEKKTGQILDVLTK